MGWRLLLYNTMNILDIDDGMARDEYDEAHHDEIEDEGCPVAFIGYPPREITCKRCGTSHLGWGRSDGKWRLFEKGELHRCKSGEQYDFIAGKWIAIKKL